jgi:hypothetical protein
LSLAKRICRKELIGLRRNLFKKGEGIFAGYFRKVQALNYHSAAGGSDGALKLFIVFFYKQVAPMELLAVYCFNRSRIGLHRSLVSIEN